VGCSGRAGSVAVIFLDDAPAEMPTENLAPSATDAIVQVKVWLLGVSPMVWRCMLVHSGLTLHELHGVFQVADG
jgi:hypothetical protein